MNEYMEYDIEEIKNYITIVRKQLLYTDNKDLDEIMKQVSQEKNKRLEGIGKKKYEWYDKWRRDNL